MPSSVTYIRRRTAQGLAALMVSNAIVAGTLTDSARAEDSGGREELPTDSPVEATPLEPGAPAVAEVAPEQVWHPDPAATGLPEPVTAEFTLDAANPVPALSGMEPEDVPVRVSAPDPTSTNPFSTPSGTVTVEILDSQEAHDAGVDGLLLKVSTDGSGQADLSVDYAEFADSFGGGWGARLRVFELPNCALGAPAAVDCGQPTELRSRNRATEQVVTTRLRMASPGSDTPDQRTAVTGAPEVRMLAVMASSSSEDGSDYRATDLSAAGSWAAGGNDGAFTYQHPLRVPPAAGPVPSIGLGYSSASHDGRTSGRNNQASWIGDGWGYDPGFIERSYTSCSQDDGGSNNNPDVTGDLCWDGDGLDVTMSLNGTNATLVRDDDSGQWRAAADPNWRIELLGSPASNSNSSTSERWKVTTPDGTQYFFASEVSASNSRLTVPVFGNHSGEPCRSSSFTNSSCRQAYRWLLDKVIDVNGNMVRYFYSTASGHYGAAGDPDNRVAYHRNGRLTRIEYGLRASDSSVPPTARVLFNASNRCLSNCGSTSNPNEQNWPDTPWDLHCDSAPCTSQLSPVFFSIHRLTEVRTQVRDGSGYRDVDSWSLKHQFLDYGDEDQTVLWLSSIQHTGQVGGTISLPEVTFVGEALPNRVNAAPGVPVMWRWRMSSIKSETGSVTTVTYADPQCTPSNLPSNRHNNSMRCYPVRWTPEFHTEPIEDWFHKYVVSSVVETDTTGGSVAVETYYDYSTSGGGTSALWAFDDSEFVDDEHRTYNLWRGYPQVTTRVGDPAQQQTRSRARFYRGMDGQPLPSGGTRSVQLTDAEGNQVDDHEALAGQIWETLNYNGSTVIGGTTYEYWTRRTARRQRNHDGGDLKAWLTGVNVESSRTRLVGSTWQRTQVRTTFDNQGRVTRVNDLGDLSQTGDEFCKRLDYVDNTSAWLKSAVTRSETVSVGCDVTPSRPGDVVLETLTFYDGSNTHGATPTKGIPTRVDVLEDWDSGPEYVTEVRTEYDALGRPVEATDALGNTSTTAYTPAGPGPVTKKVSTNALGHESTTELEPAWGLATGEVEPNGRRVNLAYDPLGRLTDVWTLGRKRATQTPSMKFEYRVRDNAPSALISRTINPAEDYITTVELFDSLLRERQVQTDTADQARLVTETIYDTHGRVEEERGPNYVEGAPSTTIVQVSEGDSPRRTEFVYDGAGRVTDEVFYNLHDERWRTKTWYGGNSSGFMVTVQPPEGAPATATIANARGETAQKRTYRSNQPSGLYDTLSYEYSPTGNLERMIDPAGNEWSWDFDLRGRTVAAHDPDSGTTTMAYDAAGQLLSTTDARGDTVVNDYDALGRQVTRHDGDGTLLAEWEYDTAIGGVGMLAKSIRWHDGEAYIDEVIRVSTQGLVSQAAITLPPSLGPLAGRHYLVQSYTHNGQVATQGTSGIGDLEQMSLTWSFDHLGNPTKLRYQGANTGPRTIVDEAAFTPFGEILSRTLGKSDDRPAWHEFAYEEDTRRLERATFDRQASKDAVADLRYEYDDAGNLLSIADVPSDLPGNHELQCFEYDPQLRLVEAWAQGDTSDCASAPSMSVLGGPAPYWNSYDHDVSGNRTEETLRTPGSSAVTRTYTYPDAGDPQPHTVQTVTTSTGGLDTFDYDEAGNTVSRDVDGQVQTLDWDAEGRITQVEKQGEDPTQMVYTADGDRLIRDDGDTVTAYLPNAEVTWDRDTDEVEGTRYFTHAGQVVAVCTGLDVADWVYLGVDHHGTTTTHAVNAFTAVEQVRRMDPYGNPRGTAPHDWPGQQGFVGGVQDPTGLVHIGARSYDRDTGRFLSVDPILLVDDDQQINGYAYAHNNPVTMTDPTGKCSTTPYGNFGCGVHNSSKAPKPNPDRCYGGHYGSGCAKGGSKSTAGNGGAGSTCLDMICRESFRQSQPGGAQKGDGSRDGEVPAPPPECPVGEFCYHYLYRFDELPDAPNSQDALQMAIANFDDLFPFLTDCEGRISVGDVCELWLELLPGTNPVRVEDVGDDYFQFIAEEGHVEGPGRRIRFTFENDDDGQLYLRVNAWGPDTTTARATHYSGLAAGLWRQYAELLSTALLNPPTVGGLPPMA